MVGVFLNEFLFQQMLEILKCWEKLKSRTLNGAFLRFLKQCFGSWDCGETFGNKDADWYFLAVFKTILLEWCFWKFELLRKLKINRLPNGAFCLNLKRCKMRHRFIIIELLGPDVIFVSFILYYTLKNGIP